MSENQENNPLHGLTLETIVAFLRDYYGFEKLGTLIRIKCFNENPSVQSSLKFLRKTPWARGKVEELYVRTKKQMKTK
ncbi:MAG: VF530 family protein [Daejeonella sp.]|uniref:VF530 family protein n=1 Tax=Daejeonella sp. TaxID=2805397 RepID=UPI00273723B5|nr:VF530 family protein [Daejeonella sp.]MDP3469984.1 VF530 family protein [Daejeonella sp.]